MVKKNAFVMLLFVICLFTGCSIPTTGKANWEASFTIGIKTEQLSEEPARVGIESTVVDKFVDSLTDSKVSNDE